MTVCSIFAHFAQAPLDIITGGQSIDPLFLTLAAEFCHEFRHQVRGHQMVFQAGQDPLLDSYACNRLAIVAGARVPSGGAAIPAVADHDVSRPVGIGTTRSSCDERSGVR